MYQLSILPSRLAGALLIISMCFSSCRGSKTLVTSLSNEESKQVGTPVTLRFTDIKGDELNTRSLKGKVVFINFWATWCLPCKVEMPSINKLKESFKGNHEIEFITVDVDGELQKSAAYLDKKGWDLPVFAIREMPANIKLTSIPTTLILNKNGNVASYEAGALNYATTRVKKALEKLIAQ